MQCMSLGFYCWSRRTVELELITLILFKTCILPDTCRLECTRWLSNNCNRVVELHLLRQTLDRYRFNMHANEKIRGLNVIKIFWKFPKLMYHIIELLLYYSIFCPWIDKRIVHIYFQSVNSLLNYTCDLHINLSLKIHSFGLM